MRRGKSPWYRSPDARSFVFARYVPFLAVGNLIWEALRLPFYTLWRESDPRVQLFALAHCKYADSMLRAPPFGTGITPLLQWIVIPPVAYSLACARGGKRLMQEPT